MRPPKFLIKTIGRTGSHIIVNWLLDHQGHGAEYWNTKSNPPHQFESKIHKRVAVIHDHTDWIPTDAGDYVMIVSLRRDVFDQICSFVVAVQTGFFVKYGPQPVPEGGFTVRWDQLMGYWYQGIKPRYDLYHAWSQLHPWRQVETVYYEDLRAHALAPHPLDSVRSVPEGSMWHRSEPSPWHFPTVIRDYSQLR